MPGCREARTHTFCPRYGEHIKEPTAEFIITPRGMFCCSCGFHHLYETKDLAIVAMRTHHEDVHNNCIAKVTLM